MTASAADSWRAHVRDFIAGSVPSDWRGLGRLEPDEVAEFLPMWRERLRTSGFLVPSWPREVGGLACGPGEAAVVEEEFVRAGLPRFPHPSDLFGLSLIGPTILHCGTAEQQSYFLPRILSGEHRWAQGFSEPDAGSDLFALRTKAVRVGDEWVIDGQKIWQTSGQHANMIFILARTNPAAPGAKGISMLFVRMDQPGVEVRPIRTMTGAAEFCSVFFDGARVREDYVLGPVNGGASVALALLGFERGSGGNATAAGFAVELDRIASALRDSGKDDDIPLRRRLAGCAVKIRIMEALAAEVATNAEAGATPGAESSILKLFASRYHQESTTLAMDVLGLDGLAVSGRAALAELWPDPLGTPNSSRSWQHHYLASRAGTIYGGSEQIQLTTIGERLLGLPREPRQK